MMTKFKIGDTVVATETRKIVSIVEHDRHQYRLSDGNWYSRGKLKKVEDNDGQLYYMQSKRTGKDGSRLFYCFNDKKKWLGDLINLQAKSIHELPFVPRSNDYIKTNVLRPKSDWEPYLTPDRELIKYEPKEEK